MSAIQAAGLWSALLILLIIVLSARVVMGRRKHRVLFGDGGNEAMILLTRAFGNAAEYIPLAIGSLTLLALVGSSQWEVHAIGGAFFVGRVIHGFGLRFGKGPGPGRSIGMLLTWLPLIAAAVMLLLAAFSL